MKKTYMQPRILLTSVSVHRMICLSNPDVWIDNNKYINAGEVESRRHNIIWDDEEEEEE